MNAWDASAIFAESVATPVAEELFFVVNAWWGCSLFGRKAASLFLDLVAKGGHFGLHFSEESFRFSSKFVPERDGFLVDGVDGSRLRLGRHLTRVCSWIVCVEAFFRLQVRLLLRRFLLRPLLHVSNEHRVLSGLVGQGLIVKGAI